MAADQDIDIHLPSNRIEDIEVTDWDTLVAMDNAYLYWMVEDSYGEWKGSILVIVSSNDLDVRGNGTEVFIRFLITHIARAQYLLDFPGNQQLFELCRQVIDPVWDKKIAY
jgi:hypothetical protein